jgi:O-antigen ligase
MNREQLDRWCERGILALVLAILVYGPLALGAVRGLEFGIIAGMTVGVMLLWAVRLWVSPRPLLFWPPICWAVLVFATYAVVRYLTADIEYVARHEMLQALVYTFLFFAILNNLYRQESILVIGVTLVFLAMGIAGYAIYQFAAFYKFPDAPHYVWHFRSLYPGRGSGTYICPNHLGGFLEMLLPLGLAYTLTGRLNSTLKIFLAYAVLVIVGGIVVSLSRGSWVSTAVALVMLFSILLLRRRDWLPAVALLVVTVGFGAAVLPKISALHQRFEQAVQKNAVDRDLRFALWKPAFRMWEDHRWWGVGPGHFDARFRAYRPEGVQIKPDRVHNDYLNTLVDWGVVGVILVAAVWGLFAWGLIYSWRVVGRFPELGGITRSNRFAFMLGGAAGLVAILVHSAVDFNFHIPANAILAVTLLALLTSYLRFTSDRFWFRARLWSRVLASIALGSGAGYLGWEGWRQAAESVCLTRAGESPLYSPQQIQWLQRAWALDPNNPETVLALGEAFRFQSKEGSAYYEDQAGVDYRVLAERAMQWFERGMKLDPWDCRNYSGYGWCLDWLERSQESQSFFARAEALDPNNYFNMLAIGLHYVQVGDFAAAKPWFERSGRLQWQDNVVAASYIALVDQRLQEAATNAAGFGFSAPVR